MNVTLRMAGIRVGARCVVLAVVPRIGEVVELEDGPWTVRQVVHYAVPPGEDPEPPYVVLARP